MIYPPNIGLSQAQRMAEMSSQIAPIGTPMNPTMTAKNFAMAVTTAMSSDPVSMPPGSARCRRNAILGRRSGEVMNGL
jgi:hypothetical protein